MRIDEVWQSIDEAPEYILSDGGRVKHWRRGFSEIRVRSTAFRKRKYVNLIVDGKVKRVYLKPLMKKYFDTEIW